jgi:hypothetical protein
MSGSIDRIGVAFPKIMEAILRERSFQDKKYGLVLQPTYNIEAGNPMIDGQCQGPGGHELGTWLIILEKELEEAKRAAVHGGSKETSGRNSIRSELVQIAAVCVAALEQHGLEES